MPVKLSRKQIRKRVQTIFKGRTPAADRVYTSRSETLWNRELPAINVTADAERTRIYNDSPRIYMRTLELKIQIAAGSLDGVEVDDYLDDYGRLIGRILLEDATLGIKVDDVIETGSLYTNPPEGSESFGGAEFSYDVQYFFFMPDDFTTQDLYDLLMVHTNYSLDGKQAVEDQSESRVEFR
jgi:hypothetical protein